jgi:ligand-binding sensor domain-containing protein/two-component sensor histidine kinase
MLNLPAGPETRLSGSTHRLAGHPCCLDTRAGSSLARIARAGWCALALAATMPAAAPEKTAVPLLSHRVWRTKDGLPQDYVTVAQPASDGFLWLGTQEGLVRFDGLHFQLFHKGNTPGLRDNLVAALAETPDGALWVGTEFGGLARRWGGRFEAIGQDRGMPSLYISGLVVDGQGGLWVNTRDMGLFSYREGRFQAFEGLPAKERVTVIAPAPDGSLWIATRSKGFFRHLKGQTLPVAAPPFKSVRTMLGDASGAFWILDDKGSLWRHLPEDPPEVFRPVRDSHLGAVQAMVGDAKGDPWFVTERKELMTWRQGGMQPVPADVPQPKGIDKICFDLAGNLWVPTAGHGLYLFRPSPISAWTRRQGLADDVVLTVCEDADGVVWAGGQDGRVTRIQAGRATLHPLPGKRAWITSIIPRRAGGVWVGTRGSGLHALTSEGRPFSAPGLPPLAMLPANAENLLEDPEGTLWIGGAEGLVGLSGKGSRRILDDRYPITSLGMDAQGRLLIGTLNHGAGVLERDSVTFTGPREGLRSEAVGSILSLGERWLVTTTGGGLARLGGGAPVTWGTPEGLWNDSPGALLADDQGRLWIGSNRGLFTIRRKDVEAGARLASIPFGCEDGMPLEECNCISSPSGWRARDGRLWFATTGGLAIVDPHMVPERMPPPPVLIERALSDGREVAVKPQAMLGKGRGRLAVQYLAPSLTDARRVVYRYRLDGFEKDWEEAGARREAFYTNLPPGKYAFRVQAAFLGHEEERSEAILSVVVPPAFYQTWWFLALCATGLGLAGWRVYYTRVRLVRLENALLTERNRIGMELHDHLSQLMTGQLLQMESARLMMDKHPGAEALRPFLERAGQLAKEGIAETRRTIQGLQNVASGPSAEGLSERLLRSILPLAEGTAVQVTFDQEGEAYPLPPRVAHGCFRVGQEAVTNALRHGEAKRIELTLAYEPRGIRLTVKDHGRGFSPAQAGSGSPGLGLAGMSRRVKELGGELDILSRPGEGTTVTVFLPRKRRWFL